MWFLVIIFLKASAAQMVTNAKAAYLINQFLDAHTAYGPGLGVFTPYWYADISYDNLPFVGKIASGGKEGTSSRLRISPLYPESGNPSNPFPPLYRARPLPPHVPEPVDVVAVPLDEEALHGEPLFPKELTLPSEMEFAGAPSDEGDGKVRTPFEAIDKKSAWIPEMIEMTKETTGKSSKVKKNGNTPMSDDKNRPGDPFGDITPEEGNTSDSDSLTAVESDGERQGSPIAETKERNMDEWFTDSDGHIVWRPKLNIVPKEQKTDEQVGSKKLEGWPVSDIGFAPEVYAGVAETTALPPKNPFAVYRIYRR